MWHRESAASMTDRRCSRFAPAVRGDAGLLKGVHSCTGPPGTEFAPSLVLEVCNKCSYETQRWGFSAFRVGLSLSRGRENSKNAGDCCNKTQAVKLTALPLQPASSRWKALWQLKHVNWQEGITYSQGVILFVADPCLQGPDAGKPH